MSRLLIAAFATLGLVVSSALAAVLLTGLAEGIRPLPDPAATLTGLIVFAAGMALAGRVAVDVGGNHALPAVALTATLVLLGGWVASSVTESGGEGLEFSTVVELAGGLAILLGVSVLGHHRRAAHRVGSPSARGGPTRQE